jgi:hypothetical protein
MVLCNIPSAPAGGVGLAIRMKAAAMIIPIFLAVSAPSAKAVPLVCSDVVRYADRLLTGCTLDADPPLTEIGPRLSQEALNRAFQEVDVILSQTRPNTLVQVGPDGLTDEPSEGKATDGIRHDGRALNRPPIQHDKNQEDSYQSTITKDEDWYYMNVDQDGTYLFLGDPDPLDRLDEWATFQAPDDGLPKGIGIGKRWRF